MKKAYIGIDGGGTNIAAGLVSKQGRVLELISHPTQAKQGKSRVIKNTLKVLEEFLIADIECLGISLAWPAPSNMPLGGLEIRKI